MKEIVLGKKTIILLISITVLSILLFIGYRVARIKIFSLFSNSITFGETQIIPKKFHMNFPFEYSWESISVVINGVDLFFEKPKIVLDPMLGYRRELLNVSIDSVYAGIKPEMFTDTSKNDIKHISHPDLWLPFRVSINVGKVAVDVKKVGNWKLDSLVAVKSGRQKRFYIRAKDIRGTHIARNIFLNTDYRWNELFSDASISISDRIKDSIAIDLNAPRERLENLSANVKVNIRDLPFWLKDKWPSKAPGITKIALNTDVSYNVLTNKMDFNLDLKTKIGEFWQLPAFDATVTAFGNDLNISQSEIILKGSNGESIKFKGNVDRNLDGSGELEINGINITLGPETLPADVKFHKITKRGTFITTDFTTGAGSYFTAKVADMNNPTIMFSANLNPTEPWAVQWTKDNVKLAEPTTLTGSFSFAEVLLNANLKTGVPYAYYAAADELDVSLWLNPEGIRFPKGTIRRKGYVSSFTGNVMWNEKNFTFKLKQQGGGEADVYGKFLPKIDLSLQNLDTRELPFADTAMLKGYNGIISGNWNHDFLNKKGKASVSLTTVFRDLALSAKTDVEMSKDSLFVKNFEIEQEKKRITGSLFAHLPTTPEEKFEILQAAINVPNMNIASLLAAFKDSTLLDGYANGNLEYDKKTGLTGELILSKIAMRGLDSEVINFSDFRVETSGHSAKVFVHLFLRGGLWNGNLEAGIDKIGQESNLPIYLSYSASNIDNVGNLKFEGILSKDFEKISGDVRVLGDWFLPSGMGEIKKADINISVKTVLGKNALDSLTAKFNTGENIYEYGIFKIPFGFSGQVHKGMLLADTILVYGQNDERVTAKLQFDLEKAVLKDLSFNTELFTLFLLNEHWIKIKNGTGRTKFDNDGITVFAELPSISYRMESADYGMLTANLKGQAAYRFPFHVGQSQTNPSITGNFEIGKASYKNSIVILDPRHFDKTLKTWSKFIESMFKEKRVSAIEKSALTGRPTTLNIKIQTGREEATISSNIAEFAFGVNLTAQGTTKNILLSGDINAIGNGKIGYNSLTMFDMSLFRVYWHDAPIKNGIIEMRAYNDYPLCSNMDESCTIFMDINGPLTKLNMQPTTDCSIEASPALIYYSMLLGCISTDYESSGSFFDAFKLRNKGIGVAMSYAGNKALGADVIGDVDFKWTFSELGDNAQETDTNYVKIPISLSKWVKSLEIVLGFTNDISLDPRYDQSQELGLRYSLPVFDSNEVNVNLIEPSLDISTNLVRRSYQVKQESGQDEARLEKNVGLVYRHKFWDPCILGVGRCKARDTRVDERGSETE